MKNLDRSQASALTSESSASSRSAAQLLLLLAFGCLLTLSDEVHAAPSVCQNLVAKAGRLYQRAVKMLPAKDSKRVGQLVPACGKRGLGRKAETLYRAAMVYKCPRRYQIAFRLAVLYRSCLASKRASCRYFGMYRRLCRRASGCRKGPVAKQKLLGKLLPFLIQDAQTDTDRDGFRSCLKTRVECSVAAQIKEIPLPGLGTDGTGKPGKARCDCDDGDAKVRPGAFEICDGKDNDCDGLVDEAPELTPPPCSNQRGVCRGSKKRCGGAKGWLLCGAGEFTRKGVAYETKETLCDGLDNDCDGRTDNSLVPPKCRNQRGVCQGASKVCGGKDGWQACTVNDFQKHAKAYELSEQRCDGLDNDCDGRVDAIKEAPPCRLQAGICEGLKKKCGGKRGWLACTPADYQRQSTRFEKVERSCDNIDNDCDGKVDESCMPIYPWVIAGGGAALLLTGILVQTLAIQRPEDVATQPISTRPTAGEVRGMSTFGTTAIVLGSVAVATGLGIGVFFLVRALHERRAPAATPPPKARTKALVSRPLVSPGHAALCSSSSMCVDLTTLALPASARERNPR